MTDWYTSGDIARLLGANFNRVRYLLSSRGIAPVGRAGITKIYDASALRAIARELDQGTAPSPTAAADSGL